MSFEDAVMRVIAGIGRHDAGRAVGKSAQMVYRWGDEDDNAMPTVREALALDAAYVSAGLGEAPILAAYQAHVSGMTHPHTAMQCTDRLCEVMQDIGDVAGEVRAAVDPNGHGGVTVTLDEHAAASAAIAEARHALDLLQRDLDAAAGLNGPRAVNGEG